MPYTFVPEKKYAKAFGRNLRMSTKSSEVLCRVIKNKPLRRSKRLLEDLAAGKRNLGGKYYTKTVKEFLGLLSSCEKNAEFLGLDADRLFVHASAHMGTIMRRRRRKASFGSRIKSTNLEIMLIEKGRESKSKIPRKALKAVKSELKENDGKQVVQP